MREKSSTRPFLAHPAGGQETTFFLRVASGRVSMETLIRDVTPRASHGMSHTGSSGALDGGLQCRMSISRNGYVPCHNILQILCRFLDSLMLVVNLSLKVFKETSMSCR